MNAAKLVQLLQPKEFGTMTSDERKLARQIKEDLPKVLLGDIIHSKLSSGYNFIARGILC